MKMYQKRVDINLSPACINRISQVLAEAIAREIVADAIREVKDETTKVNNM